MTKIIITNEEYFLESFSKKELKEFKTSIAAEIGKSLGENYTIPSIITVDRKDHTFAVEIFELKRYVKTNSLMYFYYEYAGGAS